MYIPRTGVYVTTGALVPFSIHVSVAARGVAELSPTPTPLRTAIVASVPVMEEQNAYRH